MSNQTARSINSIDPQRLTGRCVGDFQFERVDVRTAAEVTTPVSATAEIVTFDGLNATVAFYDQPDGSSWVEVTAKGEGDAAKDADGIVKRTKGWAYKIPAQPAKLLQSTLADLLTPVTPKPAEEAAKPAAEPAKPGKQAAKPGK